jgi:hypothetical protein
MNDSTPSGIFARHIEGAKNFGCTVPLYTTPPQRTWVGLSDEDKQDWIKCMPWPPEPAHLMVLIEGVELELKELNR